MNYVRVFIRATVRFTSALRVESGEEAAVADRLLKTINNTRDPKFADWEQCQQVLKIDRPINRYRRVYLRNGRAAIPASSFRGLWRRAATETPIVDSYFGKSAEDEQHLSAGWLRISDLQLQDRGLLGAMRNLPMQERIAGTGVTQGIRIDPITGTAAEGAFWAYEYVPAGAQFELDAQIVPPHGHLITTAHLEYLVGALSKVGSCPALAIGHATSKGFGLAEVKINQIRALDAASLKSWLSSGGPLRRAQKDILIKPKMATASKPIVLDLHFPFGLLAGEPMLSRPKQKSNEPAIQGGSKENAKQQYTRDANGMPMVRGSTLKGLLRGHATRIMATAIAAAPPNINALSATDAAKLALSSLFGDTKKRSRLSITDATWPTSDVRDVAFLRTFVAVDRFTGGAAHKKLYDALQARACSLRCSISIDRELQDWEKGLLLHVLKDAFDGDLALGWGKSKGLGTFRITNLTAGRVAAQDTRALCDLVGAHPEGRLCLDAFDLHVAQLAQTAIDARPSVQAPSGSR